MSHGSYGTYGTYRTYGTYASEGFIGGAEHLGKAGIRSQILQVRIDARKGEANRVLLISLAQPEESVVAIVEQAVDDRNLVSRHPLLATLLDDLFQDLPGLFDVSGGGQHVRALGAGGWGVAGENALLIKCGQRFRHHALLFIGPSENRMCRNAAGVDGQSLSRLRNRVIEA